MQKKRWGIQVLQQYGFCQGHKTILRPALGMDWSKIKRYWEANQSDFESKIFTPLNSTALMGEAVIVTYADILPEDLIENEAKIGSACYCVQLSSFSSKLNPSFILIHLLMTRELGVVDSRGCEGDDFQQRR